jgi:hypothetical protein
VEVLQIVVQSLEQNRALAECRLGGRIVLSQKQCLRFWHKEILNLERGHFLDL